MNKPGLKVARRYARALFESCDFSALESMLASLRQFLELWEGSEILRATMHNPAVPMNQKESALKDVCALVKPTDDKFSNFISLLLNNKRLEALPQIVELFAGMIDQARKVMSLEITSAFNLDGNEKQEIEKKIQASCGSMATITWEVDPSLIGGLTVKAGDRLIDASLAGSLDRVRNQLIS
ncbi:MAG: F0F1 ATP synthase subunit delta [Bdellovibrionales bacterium]|nr:F0F1 ATP synthase subunit delta [Bdellovibrionales bacterium]